MATASTFAAGDALDAFAALGAAASIQACALAARSAAVSSGSAAGAGFSATATVEAVDPARTNSPLSLVMKRTVSTSDAARVTTRAARGLPRAATRAAGRALSAAIWEEATANIVMNATARVLEARSPFADKPPSDADIDADWLVRIDADEIAPSGTSCAFSQVGTCRPLRVPKHFYRQRGAVPRAAGTSADTEMSTRLASVRAPATCAASAAPRRSASARTASTSTSASSRRVDRLTSRVGRESWVVSGRGARSAATRAAGDGPDDPVSDASSRATVTNTKRNSSTGVEKDDDASVVETKVDLLREFKNGVMFGETMRKRFTEARIDDKGLPIADALVVTTVPVFVATCVLVLGVPRPSWLVPAPWIPKWRSLRFSAGAVARREAVVPWIPGAGR